MEKYENWISILYLFLKSRYNVTCDFKIHLLTNSLMEFDFYRLGVKKMRKIAIYFLSLSGLISIPLLHTFYNLLNNSQRGAYFLGTAIDEYIPFIDVFIIPYIIWYPFIFITMAIICWTDRKTYWKALITMQITMVVCYFIYFIFQTHVPRPEVIGNGFSSELVKLIYANDAPYNAFPSIHSLTSFLMLYAAFKASHLVKGLKIGIATMAIVIIISTLFVKQHVILDAISAVFLGYFVYNAVEFVSIVWKRVELKQKLNQAPIEKRQLSRIGNQ
jgi:membrane-associated phospholipid phosphatase